MMLPLAKLWPTGVKVAVEEEALPERFTLLHNYPMICIEVCATFNINHPLNHSRACFSTPFLALVDRRRFGGFLVCAG